MSAAVRTSLLKYWVEVLGIRYLAGVDAVGAPTSVVIEPSQKLLSFSIQVLSPFEMTGVEMNMAKKMLGSVGLDNLEFHVMEAFEKILKTGETSHFSAVVLFGVSQLQNSKWPVLELPAISQFLDSSSPGLQELKMSAWEKLKRFKKGLVEKL